METNRDFKELLELFNEKKVEYILVGAYALAFHGLPRNTGDMDIWINPSPQNAPLIIKALEDFGFGSLGLTELDFTAADTVIQLGVVPSRIDILTEISGVAWTDAWANKNTGLYGDIPIFFLGKGEFIRNKQCTGRLRDLADIEAITKSQGPTPN